MSGMEAGERGRRWEYLRAQVEANKIKDSDAALEAFGRQGWELVSTVFTDTWVHFWLKRPREV